MSKELRTIEGQFIEGTSGNPRGRPRGAKNAITLYKMAVEETFRARNEDRIQEVLDSIVEDALNGDKAARKLIWDASVSKAAIQEDKTAGTTQSITVHHMNVTKEDKTDEQ
jgi:hypothetical protein